MLAGRQRTLNIASTGLHAADQATWEGWLGRKGDAIAFYGGFTLSLSDFDYGSLSYMFRSGNLASLAANYSVISISLPLFCTPSAGYGTESLATVAPGGSLNAAYVTHQTSIANYLASVIPSNVKRIILRLGWEFNGNWYPHCPGNAINSGLSLAANAVLYDQIVGQYYAILLATGLPFELWFPLAAGNNGAGWSWDWTQAFNPARGYVGISLDRYYTPVSVGGFDNNNSSTAWTNALNGQVGLTAIANFALAQGLPLGVHEWGQNIDDLNWFNLFTAWMKSKRVAFQGYFEDLELTTTPTWSLSGGQYPTIGAAYQAAFGP